MAHAHKRSRRLVLFNHKGGVGKTTLTVNLAHALVEAGRRVLLVDTDPQCSLSSFFLEEKYLDKLLDEAEGAKGKTLWTALRPVSEGIGPTAHIEAVKVRDRLHLVVGDIRLSEFESSLAGCWNQCIERNRRGYHCTTALSRLVNDLASETRAEFVFFDLGPNIGPLNRVVLLDCSHFIIPAACDLFSTRALKTLGFALREWVTTWQRVVEMAPDGTPLLAGSPLLLGYVPQGFRVYRGDMAEASLTMLSHLERRVVDFVWKPLRSAYQLSLRDRPPRLKLAEVKYFGTLATISQKQGEALWGVHGGNSTGKADAKAVFAELAKQVIELTA